MKDPYATYFEDREYAEIARREHLIGRVERKREAIKRGRFNWRTLWASFMSYVDAMRLSRTEEDND